MAGRGLDVGDVNFAGALMCARDDEHAAHCQVLSDHQAKLDDLRVAEMRSKLCLERSIDRAKIRRHSLGITYCECISRVELSLGEGLVNLGHRFFVESLTRRRRVPGEESSIALVDGSDFEASQLFDAGGDDAFLMPGAKEGEEFFEELRRELHHVHGLLAGCHILFCTHTNLLRFTIRPSARGAP